MTSWWLAWRYFGGVRKFLSLPIALSLLGMMIGVSSLVVSMAVFSGYTSTLEKTVQDAFGHMIILKRSAGDQSEMLNELSPKLPGLVAATPFVNTEAILAHKGKISGVAIEGIDLPTVTQVLNLKARLVRGEFDLATRPGEKPRALIGKGIAEKFGLQVGDEFRLVVPMSSEFQSSSFRPKLGAFKVAGIVSYGRYDFDVRYVVLALPQAQSFLEMGSRVTGYRVRLSDAMKARDVAANLNNEFKLSYWARDWQDVNRNLFEAAKLEKAVLFFVLMILVVAAAFNIANTLFISVVRRYRDISVLKTLGAPNRMVRRLFSAQGLMVGAVGSGLGVAIGLSLCRALEWAQTRWQIVPAEVYKLDHIELDVRGGDLVLIVLVSMAVCFVATMVPSRRGARISPVEGLRYE